MVNRAFGTYCWRTKISSIFPSLYADQYTRMGTIREEPDRWGFFVTQEDGEEHLCCILRGRDVPSLYRGRLTI